MQIDTTDRLTLQFCKTMRLTGTRTFLETKVGDHHSVEVILYVSKSHLTWFNQVHLLRAREFLELLQNNVLPRMFGKEIEAGAATMEGRPPTPELGPGGVPIEQIAETTRKRAAARKEKASKDKKQKTSSKTSDDGDGEGSSNTNNKSYTTVRYAFGPHLQIAYRLQAVAKNQSATLVYDDAASPLNRGQHFKQLHKLGYRILCWCAPYTNDNGSGNTSPPDQNEGGALPRPDCVPLSELFRQQDTTARPQQPTNKATPSP